MARRGIPLHLHSFLLTTTTRTTRELV